MTSDHELEELEQLYRSIVPDESAGAPEEVAAKVKYFAREHINQIESKKVVSINKYRRAKASWSGIGLAAGIILGIYTGSQVAVFSQLGARDENIVYAESGDSDMVFMGSKEALDAVKSLEDSTEDEWQRKIAELALLGEMSMVESLSKEFNRRFPDYEK
jgi:hypothetical protein